MKKLTLTSLMAVFAVSAANAAAINDNPLYRPDQGKFYSMTAVASNSKATTKWAASEEFGYGITDKLAIAVATSVDENDWFDSSDWDTLGLGLSYRVMDMNGWMVDLTGSYGVGPVMPYKGSFLDKDLTSYQWSIGAQVGKTMGNLTLAGHVAMDYVNSESFNWNDDGWHTVRLGADAFLTLNDNWALVGGVEYTGTTDDKMFGKVKVENAGTWTGTVGVNYNFCENSFVGAYVGRAMSHKAAGEWSTDAGFAFGGKFGIQF